MIIAVSGTQNIGKSTFIKDFIAANPDFTTPVLDYRKLIEDNGLKINREGDLRSQQMLLDFIITDIPKHTGNVIFDRSAIDAYVYGLWHRLNRAEASGFTMEAIRYQYEQMRKAVGLYDKILFIPLSKNPDIKVEDDKFRDTNLEYRAEIDRLFTIVIESLGERFRKEKVVEIYGSREQRLLQANSAFLGEKIFP